MGCFLACFGGGDGNLGRRKSRTRSPARIPPRPDHVATVGKASSPADMAVMQGASPPLPEARALAPPPPPVLFVEVAAAEAVTAASPGKEQRVSSEQKTLTSPLVYVLEEVVTGASPGRDLRQLTENKESPASSFPQEKLVTPLVSQVKCSPVAAAVISALDMEPRDVSEEDSHSGGKEKVKFDNSVPDVGASLSCKVANQTKKGPSNSSKGDVSVDASLSTWLVSSDNSIIDKAQSKSPRSVSSICREESTGIPNTTSKYREDRRVNWHSTPFNVRLDKALKKSSA